MGKKPLKQTFSELTISTLMIASLICLLLASAVIFTLFLFPYTQAASWANHLVQDGQLESFTLLRYQQLRIPGLAGAALLALISISGLIQWRRLRAYLSNSLSNLPDILRRFRCDWVGLLRAFRQFCDRRIILAMLVLSAIAIALRIFLIMRPMEHDEAYTAVIFGFEPLHNGLSDYHFPNNHVFHTLLLHISYSFFGANEWAVRLPAFIFGILLAPFGFLLAKRWYGLKSAWLAGIIIAALPALIDYSVNARGYTLMAFFTLLTFILGTYVKRHNNLAAWLLLIVSGALGFYTLPIMVYPLAILYIWLALAWLIRDYGSEYHGAALIKRTLIGGTLTAILGLAFYIPIFRNWGIRSLLANPYVEALSKETYNQVILSRFQDAWQLINRGLWPFTGLILIIGFGLSLIFYRRITNEKIPLQIVSMVTIVVLVAVQRPNVLARTWVFLLPLLGIWAAVGLVTVFEQQRNSQPHTRRVSPAFILMLFWGAFFLIGGILYNIEQYPVSRPHIGEMERATLFLQKHLQPGDVVVITAVDDAPMWFYFAKYGLSRDIFARNRPFKTAYVVVNASDNQTVLSVIRARGPDRGFFDFSTQQQLTSIGRQQIYIISANQEALQKAYPDIRFP
ncbi:MAG: hypothetical protein BGO78_05475 [Chloroflexi bacterium 44-23]|nr:MAG: hypothetical protein BGO78_05475 [Chloroflexi bacterium 44-23]